LLFRLLLHPILRFARPAYLSIFNQLQIFFFDHQCAAKLLGW